MPGSDRQIGISKLIIQKIPEHDEAWTPHDWHTVTSQFDTLQFHVNQIIVLTDLCSPAQIFFRVCISAEQPEAGSYEDDDLEHVDAIQFWRLVATQKVSEVDQASVSKFAGTAVKLFVTQIRPLKYIPDGANVSAHSKVEKQFCERTTDFVFLLDPGKRYLLADINRA